MRKFMLQAAARCKQRFADYDDLHTWSVERPEQFWPLVADYAAIDFAVPAGEIMRAGTDMRSTEWFVGARLNFAANLLHAPDDSPAIIACDETGRRRVLSRRELVIQAAAMAAGMRRAGVSQGDRVAAVLPNCPEAVVVMLAAASIGAIFSSCSPDFGEQAILKRFKQIEPRLLFICDGYHYGGKEFDCGPKARRLARALPSLRQLVVVPVLAASPDASGASLYSEFLVPGAEADYAELPFDQPLCILYSSGTTGEPKCIVHGAGGTLLQHVKEHLLHVDLHPGERIFYYTTCGWMMWNWLVTALAVRATLVLYDGSPFYPGPKALLDMAVAERVNVFGTSPRYLMALEKSAACATAGSLGEVRTILSTGAPLAAESYDFVAASFGRRVQLSSISGGTDIISCFALGNPLLPVYRCELQCRGLGMAVAVYDEAGNAVQGKMGELVCTRAFPSMPLGFWKDTGGLYTQAYFERFPGVWAHGDMAALTKHDGLRIYGRSDAVLNPGGVRIGSAEVCEPALSVPEVADAIAVGWHRDDEEVIALFVVLQSAAEFSAVLEECIRAAIRRAASPRHVPAVIKAVPEIPRTLSGKAVELAVKAIINGQEPRGTEALANPEALQYFRGILAT